MAELSREAAAALGIAARGRAVGAVRNFKFTVSEELLSARNVSLSLSVRSGLSGLRLRAPLDHPAKEVSK